MVQSSKRVLIVNDDGIDAPGINLLEKIAGGLTDDVWVVAPDEERSGTGQSISVSHPIRYVQRDDRHFAVRGTPADCALLGINHFLGDRKPDILLAGINAGPNLAEDVHYSGTCAAAKEGALLGIPSIALNQMRSYRTHTHWDASEAHLPAIVARLLAQKWRPGTFLNINVPNLPASEITGVLVTSQGQRLPGGFLPVMREDERTVPYFWIRISPNQPELIEGTDLHAVAHGAISITPMHLDLTCHDLSQPLETLFAADAPSPATAAQTTAAACI